MLRVGCRTYSKADKSMIRQSFFQMMPVTVAEGSPDSVRAFQLKLIGNSVVKEITGGQMNIQTSDSDQDFVNAPQTDVVANKLSVATVDPVVETIQNGNGQWSYWWTVDLKYADGTTEIGCRFEFKIESPFNEMS